MIISPITIGQNSLIAAGSVITNDIKENSKIIQKDEQHIYKQYLPNFNLSFFCFSSIYILLLKNNKEKVIPTGSALYSSFFSHFIRKFLLNSFFYSILIIFFNSLYFIDDIKNLKPYLRILISIFTGVSLLFVNSQNSISLNFSSYIFKLSFYSLSDMLACKCIKFL